MYATFLEAFIHVFAVSLSAMVTAVFAMAATRAKTTNHGAVFGLALLLAFWFAFAVIGAKAGAMTWAPFAYGPPGLAMVIALMPLFLLLLLLVFPAARVILSHASQAELIGLQGFRVVGWIFLVGWAMGDIPAIFAFPAAFGDVWAGLEGLRAARAVRRGDPQANRAVIRANIIGLADFAVAITFGLTTIAGDYNIFSPGAPSIAGVYPLVLIPALFVPLFITLHLLSLFRLRQDTVLEPRLT